MFWDGVKTYAPLTNYYVPPFGYYNPAGYYSTMYDINYYDGYGYNFYYGDTGYYEYSCQDVGYGTNGFVDLMWTLTSILVMAGASAFYYS